MLPSGVSSSMGTMEAEALWDAAAGGVTVTGASIAAALAAHEGDNMLSTPRLGVWEYEDAPRA
jgi:hypothetical protein